jgi:hypothetical protein
MFETITNYWNSITNFFETSPFALFYLQGAVLSFMIWLLYLELSPKLGGIFFRPDSTGTFRFRLGGVLPMLAYPFQSIEFWKPTNWDLNFIVSSSLGGLVYSLLKYYQSIIMESS